MAIKRRTKEQILEDRETYKKRIKKYESSEEPLTKKDVLFWIHTRTYEPEIVAQHMLEWVDREESISFTAFCSEYGYLPALIWRLEKEFQFFEEIYEYTRMTLAARRERLVNEGRMNPGSWHRYQPMFDTMLHRYEEADKDRQAARRKSIIDSQQVNLVALAKAISDGAISQLHEVTAEDIEEAEVVECNAKPRGLSEQ